MDINEEQSGVVSCLAGLPYNVKGFIGEAWLNISHVIGRGSKYGIN